MPALLIASSSLPIFLASGPRTLEHSLCLRVPLSPGAPQL